LKGETGASHNLAGRGSADGASPKEKPVTCREFADFMMDYLSGELSAERRAQFEQHVSLCANCRKYLTSYEETVKLGKAAFDDDKGSLPPDVPDELVKAILAARRSA
jgi:anti-sigma factor RsiW